MKRFVSLAVLAGMAVVGCDAEEDAGVGTFSSSLSGETSTVENLNFTQMDTLCQEIQAYTAAKGTEAAEELSALAADCGAVPETDTSEVEAPETTETVDPCTDVDYTGCNATVAEIEACLSASFEAMNAVMIAFMAPSCPAAAAAAAEIDPAALEGAGDVDCEDVANRCPDVLGASGGIEVEGTTDGGGEPEMTFCEKYTEVCGEWTAETPCADWWAAAAVGTEADMSGATQGCYSYHLTVAEGSTGDEVAIHCGHAMGTEVCVDAE